MTRIFISHSHSDSEIAEQLVNFLLAALEIKDEDIRCTSVPGHELDFGMSIEEQLKRDLGKTVGLIALITKDSLHSTWVLFELGSSWAMEKLVVPILGPGLTYNDLPGPLKNYPVVRIEDENPSYRLTDVINQLASTLGISQKTKAKRDVSKDKFLNQLRAWKSKRPDPDISQQEQIEKLNNQLKELDESYKKQLQEFKVISQQKKEELKRDYQQEKQKLEQSLQCQIQQLEEELAKERSQSQELQQKLAEKESENAQLPERISTLYKPQQLVFAEKTELSVFNFEVVRVNAWGEPLKKESKQAQYFTQELGDNITLDMIAIPGGKFLMGTEDKEIERLCKQYGEEWFRGEGPQHEVTIQPFFIGKYLITQAQWRAIAFHTDKIERDLKLNPSYFKDRSDSDNRPVEQVSWDDAVEFCKRLSKLTGQEYRLPSEAEWEYACRAGTNTPFHFGETITTDLANYRGTDYKSQEKVYPGCYGEGPRGQYREETTPVGQFPPNAFGLYDMHGNVWEWCLDHWHNNYQGVPNDGSAWREGTNNNNSHLLRGGSWYSNPRRCRSAARFSSRGIPRYVSGFRVVCVPPRNPSPFAL